MFNNRTRNTRYNRKKTQPLFWRQEKNPRSTSDFSAFGIHQRDCVFFGTLCAGRTKALFPTDIRHGVSGLSDIGPIGSHTEECVWFRIIIIIGVDVVVVVVFPTESVIHSDVHSRCTRSVCGSSTPVVRTKLEHQRWDHP